MDKDQLVLECVQCMSERMIEHDKALLAQSKNAVEDFIIYMNNFQVSLRGLNRNCMNDLQRFHNSSFNYFIQHKEYIYTSLVTTLKKGIKEKLFRKNINVHHLAKYRVESVFYMMQNMHLMQEHIDPVQLQLEVMEVFLYGISTLEGHQKIEEYFSKQKNRKF